ncbi:MAG TPA: glycosyltransferase family 39 protein, partial [Roseiflexaceae bacterium]|nr:glycosyltransferase family 39 protein [Roseiflexaceae bacterium]
MSLSDNWRRRATALPRPIAVLLHPLTIALLVGVALRALLWGNLPRTGLVSDEGEYLSAASWIAAGRGFAWYQGYLWTRAPLYPLLVAGHLRLFGDSLEPIYLTQTLLSLLNVALVYALARRLTPRTESRELSVEPPSGDTQPPGGYPALGTRLFSVPFLAALLTALYFPLAAYPQLLLSETLFISLLLGAFLALAAGMEDPRPGTGDQGPGGGARRDPLAVTGVGHAPIRSSVHGPWPGAFLVLAGALLGLATLTRSLALGFVPLAALWLLSVSHATCKMEGARRILAPALVIFACCSVFVPWAIASSRLYGGPVLVDSSGAYNLLLGARTAHDGRRKDAQVRDFALGLLGQPTADDPAGDSCTPYPGPLPTQAARQAAMTREGLCLIAARPWAFAQKTLAELIDLFQINYTGAERFTDGFTTGRLPAWYVLALFLLDDTLYVLALPLAVLGWAHYRTLNAERRRMNSGVPCFNPQPSAFSVLIALWWLYNLAAAPLLFAINRFRLPLMPFAFIFAAWALVAGARALTGRHAGARTRSRGDLRAFVASCLRGDRRVCWYVLTGTLAALLWLAAATPHAYLEPRGPGEDSRWASYLGPYPSSLAIT